MCNNSINSTESLSFTTLLSFGAQNFLDILVWKVEFLMLLNSKN